MDSRSTHISRREFIKRAGSAAAVGAAALSVPGSRSAWAGDHPKLNILMIVTDQERHLPPEEMPSGYRLPGHERLASQGVVFENHHIASCVCTPSRAVLYTGQHIQKNGMFDNTNFPWSSDLPIDFTTIGDLLRQQGYYTAYKGKWHLSDAFETANRLHMPDRILVKEMEEYGFSDYFGIGDMIAHTEGGFLHDGVITSMTRSWLRGKATRLGMENKPWFMAVNLVNPHDVMYYNTDVPGGPAVQGRTAMTHLNREPAGEQFARRWNPKLPESRNQPTKGNGRPAAHEDFALARSGLVGRVPNEDARWERLNDYYLNCIQDADRHVLEILDELDDLGMTEKTIVILTSDHGEHAGAHGLSGKGATGYREQQNVPMIISHPDMKGGRHCQAVTSHVDVATTLISMAGGDAESRGLPGRDISVLLGNPHEAKVDALRPGALFNYNMFAYQDGDFLMRISEFIRGGGKLTELPEKGWKPDLTKRGAIRSIFDGRYKFNRYYSPLEHHSPKTIEELMAYNDVELFDLENDPIEVRNLASDRRKNGDLLLAMNEKLNGLIETEVGEDTGQMLPTGSNANWTLDPDVAKLRM